MIETTTPITLDTDNLAGGEDYRTSVDRIPKFRHTGMTLEFIIHYTNREESELVLGLNKVVEATVEVKLASDLWASVGPSTYFPVYPSGAIGDETYHRVLRYP